MHIDTLKKKIIISAASVGILLLGAVLAIAILKSHPNTSRSQQSPALQSTSQPTSTPTASEIEKAADSLAAKGDAPAAITKYKQVLALYIQAKDTTSAERITMRLSLLATRPVTSTATPDELGKEPVDRNLNNQLGTPGPVE